METWGIVRLLSEMMEVSSRCNVMKTQSGNRLELARGLNLDLRDRMASETSPLPPISLNVEEDGRLDRKGHDIGRRDLSAKKEESDQRRHAGDNNGFEPESCKTEALLSGSHRVGRTSWDLWIVMFLALVSATVITGWNGTNNLAEAPLQQLEVVSCSGLPSVSCFANSDVHADADHGSGSQRPSHDLYSSHPTRSLLQPPLRISCRLPGTLIGSKMNVTGR